MNKAGIENADHEPLELIKVWNPWWMFIYKFWLYIYIIWHLDSVGSLEFGLIH